MTPQYSRGAFLILLLLASCVGYAGGVYTSPPEPPGQPPEGSSGNQFAPYTQQSADGNLVVNGDFEVPALPRGGWSVQAEIPGWVASQGPGIELQNNVAGAPRDSAQHVELASHGPSTIAQEIATSAGKLYALRFSFSPRPGVEDNLVLVRWNGQTVAALNGNGLAISNTQWRDFQRCVTSPREAVLEFEDASQSDSVGGYIDAVGVFEDPNCKPSD